MRVWSVWVGSSEMNDYYLSQQEAIRLAQHFIDENYDDVAIRREK